MTVIDADDEIAGKRNKFILALDVGTTKVKCHLVNHDGLVVHSAEESVKLLYPQPGWVEIDPKSIWNKVSNVMRAAVHGGGVRFEDIICIGMSCQRSSFITWNKETGVPYHRFITWKDMRADSINQSLNNSILVKAVKLLAWLLFLVTRSPRLLLASSLKYENVQVFGRLLWVLNNYQHVKDAARNGLVAFGTLDTWLLYKFGCEKHITDHSNVISTAMFCPHKLDWLYPILWIAGVPSSILPSVLDSAGKHFGSTHPDIFGLPVPIRASIADQPASMFGSLCCKEGSVVLTLGTGAFFNVNVGKSPPTYLEGFYPIIAWKIGDEITYAYEGNAPDLGTVIEWALHSGLCEDVHELTQTATSVPSSDGIFFIPTFHGSRMISGRLPAAASFIGITRKTSKAHMMRALLESLAFSGACLYENYAQNLKKPVGEIRVGGGVANNDFILQKLANLTGARVTRFENVERSSLGAAYLAGLAEGFWKSRSEIAELAGKEIVFYPDNEEIDADWKTFQLWKEVVRGYSPTSFD
ncbi:Glycerol kinase [Nesidiocoris tenuis]|uniref:Glycerol kinase 5 n=1 Tax=Nesidiocoris tenuis TaxID=355587 RepID=A0ABN7AG95_9HEMI|nr:Glycerol kinase [Nesidiocoris tenuis]